MPVLQKTPIGFFKQFPTAMHSGKMYIRHLFRCGQLQKKRRLCSIVSVLSPSAASMT